MNCHEVNFDGLVGPTHNYAGLAYGNIASSRNRNFESNPKAAAIQGLDKMRALHELGLEQAILPPQMRPDLEFLRNCGFQGSPGEILRQAQNADSVMLAASISAASMWTANAATISPSSDSRSEKLQITPANLSCGIHRSIECSKSWRVLSRIFAGDCFEVHHPLPGAHALSDEGAANHLRLAPCHSDPGLEVFVFGRDAFDYQLGPQRFPARQTLQASQAIARKHQLDPLKTLFWRQSQKAIDRGAFHNDVVAVSNENLLLCHQAAFENQVETLRELKLTFERCFSRELFVFEVAEAALSLDQAVETYLFNSQLVTVGEKMVLVAPVECKDHEAAQSVINDLLQGGNPVQQVIYPDVKQSMRNGGGPACLRLRVLLSDEQLEAIHQGVRYNLQLDGKLRNWIDTFYREQISPADLADPGLYHESMSALTELELILGFESGLLTA